MSYIKLSAFCFLWAVVGICHGAGILSNTFNGAVGDSVTFTTTVNPPVNPFLIVTWIVNDTIYIVTSTSSDAHGPGYEDRITLYRSTGSLELRNLSLNDSGLYSVSVTPDGGLGFNGKTTLTVYEPVSNVSITANVTDLEEFSGSVILTCSSSGSSLSYLWLNGSSEVTAREGVQIGDGGSTLTIVNVTRYDQGPFKCNVSNVVSHNLSRPLNLNITYGPENIVLMVTPSDDYYAEGSNLTLSCSADSRPPATFQWVFNGTLSPIQGPVLRLDNIQPGQGGNYSCVANNSRTLKHKTSELIVIAVLEKVSNGTIHPKDPEIIEGDSTTLTCDAAGSISAREWTKDDQPLSPNDRITFSKENRTLSISPAKRTDKGKYQCTVKNPLNSVLVESNIKVIYGPDNARIEGLPQVGLGETLSLKCTAEFYPTATYTWMLNETEIAGHASEFTKEKAESTDSGHYICRAKNDVTGNESISEPFAVKVSESIEPPQSGLSAGAIAGIVIGVLLLVVLLSVLIVYMVKYKGIPKRKNANKNRSSHGPGNGNTSRSAGAGFSNGAGPGDQEVSYADISHFQKKDGGRVQLGNMAASSETNDQLPVRSKPGQPSSLPTYDAHMQHGHAKRPAPQPAQTPNTIYSDVRRS